MNEQSLVTLDMEGVLTPEIWLAVAERTGLEQLKLTTRDLADYDELMTLRLRVLADHGLTFSAITEVIASLVPLEGARDFLDRLRERTQVVVLSDTFEEFAGPLLRQLGWPTCLCHRLEIENDRIVGYRLRQSDQKRRAVTAFRSLNYRVIAAGDSFNDVGMLEAADIGFLFRSRNNIQERYPQFRALEAYQDLLSAIEEVRTEP